MHHSKSLLDKLVSIEHLFFSWQHFVRGKEKRKDVQVFARNIEDHLFQLQEELEKQTYCHCLYHKFYVFEPKQRFISKACVCDQCVHHMLHNMLSAVYESCFFFHSYSCRINKGRHKGGGVNAFVKMLTTASLNKKRPVYVLKLDIKRFFDSVDHAFLKSLLRKRISDSKVLQLLDQIIDSFHSSGNHQKGLPLGNVTSQIFANIYLHELDCFIKHVLKEPFYVRYCDDFVVVSHDKAHLKALISIINEFLQNLLFLQIRPQKITLRKWDSGIDFLGYICFPHYKLLRKTTKKRLCKRLSFGHDNFLVGVGKEEVGCEYEQDSFDQCLQSYLGILSHANHQKCIFLSRTKNTL
mgnify:CR=1 FL=1